MKNNKEKKGYYSIMSASDRLNKLCINNLGFDPNNKEECLKAVKQSAHFIRYIKNPSTEVQLESVKKDGFSLQYIKDPSEEVQLESVKHNAYSLQYIKDPSEEVKLAAVKKAVLLLNI